MSVNSDDQPEPLIERTEPPGSSAVAAQASVIDPAPDSSRFSPRSSNGPGHSVELHIEEMVLHGFEPAHRYAIGDAIERELTRLFTEQDAPSAIAHDGETAHLDGGALQIDPDSNADEIGARVARAIYGGLSQ